MRRWQLACVAMAGFALPLVAQEPAHHHSHTHSHRGPGPHFVDAFFVENAYLERKIRPDLFYSDAADGQRLTGEVEVEWALVPRLALIVHAPIHRVNPDVGSTEMGIGDVSVGAKVALINDRSRFILAAGSDIELATGDEERGLGEGHSAAAPFLLAWVPFGAERRWLLQGAAHAAVPLEGDEATHGELGVALSWTSPAGLTPMLEGLVEFPLEGEGGARWAVAPGFRYELGGDWEIGATVRVGLGSDREENVRFGLGFIHHFPLPE